MRILLTGAAGFIGTHTYRLLKAGGYDVHAVNNPLHTDIQNRLWGGALTIGDIADAQMLDQLFSDYRPDMVIHLAGKSNAMESVNVPASYYHNIVATKVLLDTMQQHQVSKLIFASTAGLYKQKNDLTPYCEEDALLASNPYTASKAACEQMIQSYAHAHDWNYVIMRHFNPAGAQPDNPTGALVETDGHAIAVLVRTALGIQPEFILYGTDYDTPDGTSIRDYVHVGDVARAHVCAVEYLQAGKPPITVNIGSGKGTSLRQLITKIEAHTGHPLPIKTMPRHEVFQAHLIADITKAEKQLNWQPKCSSLDHIITTTIALMDSKQAKGRKHA